MRVNDLGLVVFKLVDLANFGFVDIVAHCAYYIVQATHHCGIRDARLFFRVLDLALAFDECFNEAYPARLWSLQAAEAERSVYSCASTDRTASE